MNGCILSESHNHKSFQSLQADLLAARARLFFNGSAQSSLSASDSVINHRPLDLEEECRMITSKIKQVHMPIS